MDSNLKSIIKNAILRNASDIHICNNEPVRFRIDDSIILIDDNKFNSKNLVQELLEGLEPEYVKKFLDDFLSGKEIDFSLELENNRLRINAYRDLRGDNVSIRIIKKQILSSKEIDLPEALIEMSKRRNGLIILTGASGSGKSTTMACLIEEANIERDLHVITIEDPIEYVFENKKSLINQRQVGLHTKSFASGLRSALREDPDLIMIGELRDLETVRAALNLAETGHLVFATMHTSSSAGALERIIDYFPHEEQAQIRLVLADVLLAVLTQSLLPKKTGGRIAAFEFLISNLAVKNLIREAKVNMVQNVLQTSSSVGMITMKDSYLKLLADNIISLEVAKKYYPGNDKLL